MRWTAADGDLADFGHWLTLTHTRRCPYYDDLGAVTDVRARAMNREQWAKCQDARRMLDYLREKASERKLRLYAVAVCCLSWDFPSVFL